MSHQRSYDIIIWGATGFTGQLAVEKLYQRILEKEKNNELLRWGIAGRNIKKLQSIKDSLLTTSSSSTTTTTSQSSSNSIYPHILQADINHYQTIQNLVSSTHVILALAGPFFTIGEPIVKACVENGTHYADITGETIWVKRMIEKYSEQALQSGSRLISMSGFDSIPSDLGSLYACTELKKKFTKNSQNEVIEDHAYITGKNTSPSRKISLPVSIGTISSAITLMDQDWSTIRQSSDPYLLVDQPLKAELQRYRSPHDRDQFLPQYSQDINQWTAPFVMAIVNTRVVRRSYALYKQYSQSPYGQKFSYNESVVAPNIIIACIISLFSTIGSLFLLLSPVRRLLEKFLAYTGYQGPSEEARKHTVMIFEHVAKGSDGSKLHAIFRTEDGGYGGTGTMIVETGLLLLEDARNKITRNKAPESDGIHPIGFPQQAGFLTPSSAFGYRLINRLNDCDGFEIQVKKFIPAPGTKSIS